MNLEDGPRLLRAWQLALLRFAVTRDDCDRVTIAALAGELDRAGRRNNDDSVHFFRRSSSRLCAAIGGQREDDEAILARFCEQIDDPRLRLAIEAALGIARASPAPAEVHRKRNPDLFRGLPSRRAVSL